MKKYFVYIVLMLMPICGYAATSNSYQPCDKNHQFEEGKKGNPQKKFDPEQYERELGKFIAREAKLTPQEIHDAFPIYKEMQKKMRELFNEQRKLISRSTFSNEEEALRAIKKSDELDIKMKKVQQCYHDKLLKVLPATKVLKSIKAVERFNHNMFRQMRG